MEKANTQSLNVGVVIGRKKANASVSSPSFKHFSSFIYWIHFLLLSFHEGKTMRKIMGNKPQASKLGYNYPQSSENILE
jgi:hypothetical protein